MNQLLSSSHNLTELIERELNRKRLSPNTRRSYRSDLARFEEWRQGKPLTKVLVEEYINELTKEAKAPATINRSIAAIRWWTRRLVDLAYNQALPEDPQTRADWKERREEITLQSGQITAIEDVKDDRALAGREISVREFEELIRACEQDQTAAGVRDRAILSLAWVTGMRRAELASLDRSKVTETQNGTDPSYELKFTGKGSTQRENSVFGGAALNLKDWFRVRGDGPGPVFCQIRKGGHMVPETRLSGESLRKMLEKRRKQAGVAPLTWHDFRRTLISNKLGKHDLVVIGKIVGHRHTDTTARYDRRSVEVRKAAERETFVPHQPMVILIEE